SILPVTIRRLLNVWRPGFSTAGVNIVAAMGADMEATTEKIKTETTRQNHNLFFISTPSSISVHSGLSKSYFKLTPRLNRAQSGRYLNFVFLLKMGWISEKLFLSGGGFVFGSEEVQQLAIDLIGMRP